ncbi:MAG: hypothetical protein FJX74_04280 [Armatimonadetes bacterium]|nr:hypothetical protein [Armatimonadota bacterium]
MICRNAAIALVALAGLALTVAHERDAGAQQETLYRADFGEGLPEGWKKGVAVLDGLPEGVAGAVGAEPGGDIESNHQWVDGHFTVAEGLHLNFRATFSNPQWYQLFIFCKQRGPDAAAMNLYEYKPPVDAGAAGEWQVVSAPLSEFRATTGPNQGQAPLPGEVCWTYFWGFQGRDLGMLVDLVWVTEGAPASTPAPAVRSDARGLEGPTWAFEPPRDEFSPAALFDLRLLNEKIAGQSGFVRRSDDGNDFVLGDGTPARFWAVNTSAYNKHPLFPAPDLARHARFLAKRGINMVRVHANVTPEAGDLSSINPGERDNLWRTVAAMKPEGIYTTFSPYWAASSRVKPEMGVLDTGGEVGNHGLLFFDPALQAAYKSWLKQILAEPNPHTGIPLSQDPALAIIQLQNEDSLLFWTSQGIKGTAGAELRRQFAEFLKRKYGSLDGALAAWQGTTIEGDEPAAGRMGLYIIWELTQEREGAGRNQRCADQMQFFTQTMRDFNAMMGDYLREDLGCKQLINAGNWRTADNVRMLDAERYSYGANEVMAVNRYYTGVHQGQHQGWAIVSGDVFTDDSVLLQPRELPVTAKQVNGHPFIIPESSWVPPLGYQSEGPFLIAAYQSLNGVDAYYWFATGEEDWRQPSSANGYLPSLGKWVCHTPMLMGQWPAAALMYRMGYIQRGSPAVHERRSLENLWRRTMPIIAEDAGYDPNRDTGDIAVESNVKGGVDPLAYLVGPVIVDYDANPGASEVVDLGAYIDPGARTVSSITGELKLDYGQGVCTLNAPKAQGVTGFLGQGRSFRLGEVLIESTNDYATVLVVAMDDRPLSESRKVLVQVGTVERPTGWKTSPATVKVGDSTREGEKIVNFGAAPWQIVEADVTVSVANSFLTKATVLDPNGMPAGEILLENAGNMQRLRFPPDALYTVLE